MLVPTTYSWKQRWYKLTLDLRSLVKSPIALFFFFSNCSAQDTAAVRFLAKRQDRIREFASHSLSSPCCHREGGIDHKRRSVLNLICGERLILRQNVAVYEHYGGTERTLVDAGTPQSRMWRYARSGRGSINYDKVLFTVLKISCSTS